MPKAGDNFTVTLSHTHVDWGNITRRTATRDRIHGENYIPIPSLVAKKYDIFNSHAGSGLGVNEFNATSADGNYKGIVKTSGNNTAGSKYAKNLHEKSNLKGFGAWFSIMGVTIGTKIKVEWISTTDLVMTIIESE